MKLSRPALLAATLLAATAALAFPPAPHHIVYGWVRDELGNPLVAPGAQVFLDTESGTSVRASIVSGLPSDSNYRLHVPVDSGSTADLYKPSALNPSVPFRIRVRIGNQVYLPIEMSGTSKLVASPGATTRLDLTLGIDSDGDGLPDAWEQALIAARGGNGSLADIGPKDDTDGDGLSNLQEYVAGTYAFDPADGFALKLVSTAGGRSVLEFTAIRGRSYSIQTSADAVVWTPIAFSISGDSAGIPARTSFAATEVRPVQALVDTPDTSDVPARFFRLTVR